MNKYNMKKERVETFLVFCIVFIYLFILLYFMYLYQKVNPLLLLSFQKIKSTTEI